MDQEPHHRQKLKILLLLEIFKKEELAGDISMWLRVQFDSLPKSLYGGSSTPI
jgi:hypothetical protein